MADVKGALSDGKTNLVVITGGLRSILQPLNVVLKKPFKDRVRELYNEWMLGNNPKTPAGRLRRTPLRTVCGWESLPEEMVHKPFHKCCISNALDGTVDDALWDITSEKQTSDSSFDKSE